MDFENDYRFLPMFVCICKAVSEQTVRGAIARGASTVDAVGRVTGAGTDCGSCRHKIARELSRTQESGGAEPRGMAEAASST